jgi:phage gp36-like protein
VAYCTIDDLKERLPEAKLVELVDDEGAGALTPKGQQRIDRAIADAGSEIDGYCMARYPVPFEPVPAIIRKLAVDIALYNLFSRRGFDEESPDRIIVTRYRDAVRLLQNLAQGLVTIGAPQPPPDRGLDVSSAPRVFGRRSLEVF